jgi:hypothetical protein
MDSSDLGVTMVVRSSGIVALLSAVRLHGRKVL